MELVVADLDPLYGHAVLGRVVLRDVFEHLFERIYPVSAMYSVKKKRLLVFGIDGHQVKALDIVFLLEIKNGVVLADPQPADDLLLELCYFYILVVA
jgi:hypothetical protein